MTSYLLDHLDVEGQFVTLRSGRLLDNWPWLVVVYMVYNRGATTRHSGDNKVDKLHGNVSIWSPDVSFRNLMCDIPGM